MTLRTMLMVAFLSVAAWSGWRIYDYWFIDHTPAHFCYDCEVVKP